MEKTLFARLLLVLVIGAWAPVATAQTSVTEAPPNVPGLTVPNKNYAGTISFDQAPARTNDQFPLSDQSNQSEWVLRQDLSDEFNGTQLDTSKWHPNNPHWKGRATTFFHSSNLSLEEGGLVMRINQHGDESLPEGFTHTSGFIKSKQTVLYGYFEAETKLMDAPWISGFWMYDSQRAWHTEIDICENCPAVPEYRHDLNSNIHVFRTPPEHGNVKEHFSRSKRYYIPFELQADYHVWGLEWNKDVIRFYLDGVLYREAENTHWHQPLAINLNCESNKWLNALPDDSRLDGQYRVEYFRAWKQKR